MKTRGISIIVLLVLLAVGAVGCAATREPVNRTANFGMALNILANKNGMTMSAMKGNPVTFEKDDFLRAVNLSDLSYITVTTVPDASVGRVLIGSTTVAAGQTVSAENLPQMTYVGAEGATDGAFGFSVNGKAYTYTCRIAFLKTVNYAPTLIGAPGNTQAVSTHSGLSATGTLYAADPEGDELTFRIVGYPEHGSVILADCHAGTYTYEPSDGFTGTDSFLYAAYDRYGNWSPCTKVTVNVASPKLSVAYEDLTDDEIYNAALTVAENGIMSGDSVGGKTYFRPEKTVSRAEFVVTLMNAAGITDVPDAEHTVFADDAEIPPSMKGYISAAYSLGYITGSTVNGKSYFRPNGAITRAEAAVVVSRLTGLTGGTVAVFADESSIPAFAKDAVSSLYRAGILTAVDGKITPAAVLTRGDAAVLFERLMWHLGTD